MGSASLGWHWRGPPSVQLLIPKVASSDFCHVFEWLFQCWFPTALPCRQLGLARSHSHCLHAYVHWAPLLHLVPADPTPSLSLQRTKWTSDSLTAKSKSFPADSPPRTGLLSREGAVLAGGNWRWAKAGPPLSAAPCHELTVACYEAIAVISCLSQQVSFFSLKWCTGTLFLTPLEQGSVVSMHWAMSGWWSCSHCREGVHLRTDFRSFPSQAEEIGVQFHTGYACNYPGILPNLPLCIPPSKI